MAVMGVAKQGDDMMKENTLEAYLEIWKGARSAQLVPDAGKGGHIPLPGLYRMAGEGGIDGASDAEVDHLSLCPDCLARWARWRQAICEAEALDGAEAEAADGPAVLTCGFREAAASWGPGEPVTMRSGCGRFILGLLPQVDDPDKGLVTLEAAADGTLSVEGRRFIVRDRNGVVILDGRLRQGRLARTCERLKDLDLSAWTLVMDDDAG